jgi:hypothetical protein
MTDEIRVLRCAARGLTVHRRVAGRVVAIRQRALYPEPDPGSALLWRRELPAGIGNRVCAGDKSILRHRPEQQEAHDLYRVMLTDPLRYNHFPLDAKYLFSRSIISSMPMKRKKSAIG